MKEEEENPFPMLCTFCTLCGMCSFGKWELTHDVEEWR